ncbi:acyl carrier protein [Arthrobacter sp. efr-133-R2A-120]|uniref:acyl carrier protein n=1 Tax=Arthrobacter sp. efr-133-R2A-120 TaxID=3040277 RepID=UPI0025514DAA|nr:acyl carrier protein [Arthrobacter sp. efr-133-R2A-120]
MVQRTAQYERAVHRYELNAAVRRSIIGGLDLPVDPDLVDDDQPLFGRGLELDSLDTLEIVSLMEEDFGVYITDEQRFVFGSVNKLVDFAEASQPALDGA